MSRIILSLLLAFAFPYTVFAQLEFKKHWVSFTDKNGTPFSLSKPERFLSIKSIQRRALYNIPIQANDLPVNPNYVQAVRDIGATVLYSSRWMNGVAVQVADSAMLLAIQALPFVQQTKGISKKAGKFGGTSGKRDKNTSATMPIQMKQSSIVDEGDSIYYGTSKHQIEMLNGQWLHHLGLKGAGMTVAILDAGFSGVDANPVFAQHFANGQIRGTRDFVDLDDEVYQHSSHGAQVFSIMGANLPDYYVGAAPEADYWLLRTEEGATETTMEEYNWVAGAEFADSVGVDVINSSLGYSTFDYAYMDYTYEDMDGQVAVVTRGADLAASKGILVVTSAGNQGAKPWTYITAPADADSVLTIGAVDSLENYASFSSRGPSADGRVKPNVSGQGLKTAFVEIDGKLKKGNGTSYSAPLVAGLATCLWQGYKTRNNMDIINFIQQSATRYLSPNDSTGYGLPDFQLAFQLLVTPTSEGNTTSFLYPNPATNSLILYHYAKNSELLTVNLFNMAGQLLHQQKESLLANLPYRLNIETWHTLPDGVYLVEVQSGTERTTLKAIKQ